MTKMAATPIHDKNQNKSQDFEKSVIKFSRMFLIGSFSYLQVTITCMGAWMSSKFGWIRPRTTELAALERMKKSHRLIMGKTMSSHFLRFFLSDPMHKSLKELEIRPDATTCFHGNR